MLKSPDENVCIPIMRLPHAQGLDLPSYATKDSAGMDLLAALESPKTLLPGQRALIPTGLAMALPVGFEAQIRPRSGLAIKHGITVLNAPGTIDADYRGEINIIIINHGDTAFTIERGQRIAQMVVAPVLQVKVVETQDIGETDRGKGGFGSTGL
ncbi:deoxyuridine 5'-triphosphate nucleotidohydrolase [Iodidimonas nitroreducens]|uniref:Deoxyuridine 5'-triphosphate nucleotidohydrolase n=1 Tax=Iodidimonas nitroreducens TaxID=1236968 RepID=A0A5A7N6D0_9PROT|nr:dUTP diphosphatase [Iodidimonas nitroreducens]GAK32202.1 deoxyuridine 5'-triphosphate nucleotidohydrolase [alpha proteobacterium Q-1]GER02629.1 deoxyuridine 5'-triphosphate nucleotidohydrolase [Iodidimonas nitroreducens]